MSEAFLTTEELSGGVRLVHVVGRIDTAGAAALDLKMQAIADAHRAVVIDLTRVDFLASMGIRLMRSLRRQSQKRVAASPVSAPTIT